MQPRRSLGCIPDVRHMRLSLAKIRVGQILWLGRCQIPVTSTAIPSRRSGSSMVWTYGRVPCKLLYFEVAGSQVCIEVPQGTGFEILIKVLSSFSSDSKAFGQVGALDSYYQRRVERN